MKIFWKRHKLHDFVLVPCKQTTKIFKHIISCGMILYRYRANIYWVWCVTRIDFPCNHRVWNHPVYQNTNKLILPATHGPFRFHLLPLHEPCLNEVTVRFASHCYRLYNCSTWWTIEPDRFEAIPVVNRNGGLQTTTNRSVAYRNPCLTFSHVLTILHDGKTCRNLCVHWYWNNFNSCSKYYSVCRVR